MTNSKQRRRPRKSQNNGKLVIHTPPTIKTTVGLVHRFRWQYTGNGGATNWAQVGMLHALCMFPTIASTVGAGLFSCFRLRSAELYSGSPAAVGYSSSLAWSPDVSDNIPLETKSDMNIGSTDVAYIKLVPPPASTAGFWHDFSTIGSENLFVTVTTPNTTATILDVVLEHRMYEASRSPVTVTSTAAVSGIRQWIPTADWTAVGYSSYLI